MKKKTTVIILAAIVFACAAFAAVPMLVESFAASEIGKTKNESNPNQMGNPLHPFTPLNSADSTTQTQNLSAEVVDALILQAKEAFNNDLDMIVPADYEPASGSVGTIEADGSLTAIITFLPPDWNLATLTLGRQSVDMYTAIFRNVDTTAANGELSGLHFSKTGKIDENTLLIENAVRMAESANREENRADSRPDTRTDRDGRTDTQGGVELDTFETTAKDYAAARGFIAVNRDGYSTTNSSVEFTFSNTDGDKITITVSNNGRVTGYKGGN
jgi:hypothetical protein